MIPRVQTARDIKNAIEGVCKTKAIGFDFCTIWDHKHGSLTRPFYDSDEEMDTASEDSCEEKIELDKTLRVRTIGYSSSEMTDINAIYGIPYATGYLRYDSPRILRVSRTGCEYDGPIDQVKGSDVQRWIEHGQISGFGNVATLQTEYDPAVRQAVEIPNTEFTVEDKLLSFIEEKWSESFTPTSVRVEPYKIHLYGPGGHFRPHLDTPEHGLVGTFLLGFWDHTSPWKRFHIQGEGKSCGNREWIAFYPDVPHSVEKFKSGYRAVIAFKIFLKDSMVAVPDRYKEATALVQSELSHFTPPFGIYLSHLYHKNAPGTRGFDDVLVNAIKGLLNLTIHITPVVTDQSLHIVSDPDYAEGSSASAWVYPLTDAHLDFLLGDKEALQRDEVKWLEEIKDKIPFCRIKYIAKADLWSRDGKKDLGIRGMNLGRGMSILSG